ncbi:hypothetical protein NQZ68_036827 [Dissostichus eleginoides]|nr:hypothetical protein NQZ68_036827 [Dissostichus eleginoides]
METKQSKGAEAPAGPIARGTLSSTQDTLSQRWETHLSNAFLNGLTAPISTSVKQTCIGVMDGARLDEIRRHAVHAQHRLNEEKVNDDKKRRDRKEKAQLTMVGHTNPKVTTVAEEGSEAKLVSEAEAEDVVAKKKTPKVDKGEATKPTKKQGKMESVSSADPKTTGSMTVQKPHGTRTGEINSKGELQTDVRKRRKGGSGRARRNLCLQHQNREILLSSVPDRSHATSQHKQQSS